MENAGFDQTEGDYRTFNTEGSPPETRQRNNNIGSKDVLKVEEVGKKVELQKIIGFTSCVGIVVGTIIGSGIFISPKGVLEGSGSIGLTLIIWIVCGFFAFMGSLAYAELGSLIPSSGGQYMYLLEGFAATRKTERLFWGPLVGFLFSWQFNFIAKPAGFAIQGITCAKYLMKLVYTDCTAEDNDWHVKFFAAAIILLITFLNCRSSGASIIVNNTFTAVKLSALVCIIVAGFVTLAQGTNESLKTGFEGTTFVSNGIADAFYSGLWAYAGWDNLNMVARELKDPKRDFVRSLMISCTIVTIVYILTNVSYFIVLSKMEFLGSDAVAVTFGEKILGKFGGIILMASVACSVLGSTIGGAFATIRLCYAAAREGHMVDILSYLHVINMTPLAALVFSSAISVFMVFNSNILSLILLAGFVDNIFICITMIVLLMLRKSKKHEERAITVPVVVPLLVLCFSLFLLVMPFVDNPKKEYFYVIAFLLFGVIVYVPFVYYGKSVPFLDKVKHYTQIILQVCAPEDDEI